MGSDRFLIRQNETTWAKLCVRLSWQDTFLRLSITGEAGDVTRGRRGRAHSFGQIRETLTEFFPEFVQYFSWHLNDMHAECEHQEARGETWTTHPLAECIDCGYKLGTVWKQRMLPSAVIAWAQTVGESA